MADGITVQSTESSTEKGAASSEAEQFSEDKRVKFGTRYLTDSQNVFQHNAWDNVVWDDEQEAEARDMTQKHLDNLVPEEKKDEYERDADRFWDQFYGHHQNRFFKDRHWLFTEFPELYGSNAVKGPCVDDDNSTTSANKSDSETARQDAEQLPGSVPDSSCTETTYSEGADLMSSLSLEAKERSDKRSTFCVLEVGCGVGNTVFPVLKTNNSPDLMMYCCDFSSTAIQIVKEHPDYDEKRCHAFVHDITDEKAHVPFPSQSLDVIIMIFVLSAVCPEKMQDAIGRLVTYLKPGGTMLFRDYGRYDMAQLRFKPGRCLSENFYVRGDGTRVYFFSQGELRSMFEQAGLKEKENMIDRRLQVNRGRQLKMYRVWIQCKYIKPLRSAHSICDGGES